MKNKTSSYFVIQLAAFGLLLVGVFFLTSSIFGAVKKNKQKSQAVNSWWSIQSIDTMKYSRDLSREKMTSKTFDAIIDAQVRDIKKAGATYVAIATPYDEEFVPMLARWVAAARKYNLYVWFRGNFSGWEGWFEYPKINRDDHQKMLTTFISNHPELFAEDDIFTPCPECENGGPGDPRQTGDIAGHRLFLINEYETATAAFRKIGTGVNVGYFSMNYDVANVIMDKKTTEALGGIVTIDHYVKTPEQLVQDIRSIAKKSGGKVFIGEFGAPIPDIHGDMNEQEQYTWIQKALTLMAKEPHLVGVNYWVNVGGSTQLWSDDGTPKKAVQTIMQTFLPPFIQGTLVNQFNKPIANIEILSPYKKVTTDASGRYTLPYLSNSEAVTIKTHNYADKTVYISDLLKNSKVVIEKIKLTWFEIIAAYIYNLFSNRR